LLGNSKGVSSSEKLDKSLKIANWLLQGEGKGFSEDIEWENTRTHGGSQKWKGFKKRNWEQQLCLYIFLSINIL